MPRVRSSPHIFLERRKSVQDRNLRQMKLGSSQEGPESEPWRLQSQEHHPTTKEWFPRRDICAYYGHNSFGYCCCCCVWDSRTSAFLPLRGRPLCSHENVSSVYGTSFSMLLLSKWSLMWKKPRFEREVRKQVFHLLSWGCRTPKMRHSSSTGGIFQMCNIGRGHREHKPPLQFDSVTN